MTKAEARHRYEVLLRKRRYRTIAQLAEASNVSLETVKRWLNGEGVPTGTKWRAIDALEDVKVVEEPTDEQRAESQYIVGRCLKRHTQKHLSGLLGCSPYLVSRMAAGEVVPFDEQMVILKRVAESVQPESENIRWSEATGSHTPRVTFMTAWREYAKSIRETPEYRAIDRMRSDICEPGDCSGCGVECTARETA